MKKIFFFLGVLSTSLSSYAGNIACQVSYSVFVNNQFKFKILRELDAETQGNQLSKSFESIQYKVTKTESGNQARLIVKEREDFFENFNNPNGPVNLAISFYDEALIIKGELVDDVFLDCYLK